MLMIPVPRLTYSQTKCETVSMNTSCIVIGIGGAGRRVARQIAGYAAGPSARTRLQPLTLDTDESPAEPRDEHFAMGGFHLRPALEHLPPGKLSDDAMASLRSMALPINFGAAARAEIGLIALEMHRAQIESWLGKWLRTVPRSTANVDVIVVGSTCGGTAAGVIPGFGRLVRSALLREGITGYVRGFGIGMSVFAEVASRWLATALTQNEQYCLKALTAPAEEGPKAYDEFFVADCRAGASTATVDLLDEVARRVFACSIFKSKTSTFANDSLGEELERLNLSPGIVLLNISGGRSTDVDMLWVPGSQLASAPGTQRRPEPAFHLPSFGTRWTALIEELRTMVRRPDVDEGELQRFFETNPEFLTGFDYHRAVPHVYLSSPRQGNLVPDFLLVPHGSNLADILELKLPHHQIVVSQGPHVRISAILQHAISQLRDYEEYFDCDENRTRLLASEGFTAYKPNLNVVIGTRGAVTSELGFRRAVSAHPGVRVITYDDILERASRWLR
jgi:hypothetical protein